MFFIRGKEKMVELHWGLYAFFEQQGAGYEIMGCTLSIRPQKIHTAHMKPVKIHRILAGFFIQFRKYS